MNKRTLRVLEYDKMIGRLQAFATCPEGKRMCARLKPFVDRGQIDRAQEETEDALSRIYRQGGVSFSGVYPVKETLRRAAVGSMLSISELLDVAKLLRVVERAGQYGELTRQSEGDGEKTDALTEYFGALSPLTHLEREINRCILSEDEIADDASVDLKEIRKQQKAIHNRIHETLNRMVTDPNRQGMLQDAIVTVRDGRYCIPVRAEYKGQFPGMVHDRSSTGATYFVEPMAVVNLNNECKELEMKETIEIERILTGLTEQVAQYRETIENDAETLITLDFIFARAAFAKSYTGTRPELNVEGGTNLKQARHPLLDPKKVVPVDIRLGDAYSMLIITGPNTGGKTVSLKTLGLLTLMAQSGLHIPALQGSEMTIYEDVFADIGDEQSIEQNLSTFSSHMTNVVYIMKHATNRTLVLFDELGGGTDPVEGSALAIAILRDLHERGIRCMATTHYSELKTFAMTTQGIENACCEFDVETLSPTYRLLIGIPGKSNAFAIAGKLGMEHRVIENARTQIDSVTVDMETLLADLEQSKRTIERERREIEANKQEIVQLKERLSSKNAHIEQRKQDILRNAREEAKEILEDAKAYADASIRKYNNWEKRPQTANNKEMEAERSRLRERLKQADTGLQAPVKKRKSKAQAGDFHVGDAVHVLSLNLDGTVRSLPNQRGEMTVQMGILQSTVKLSDVEFLGRQETVEPVRQTNYHTGVKKTRNIKPEINLLGLTVDEAITELDRYLDDACLSHLNQVRIVHGKGTGALRKGVHAYLKQQPYVKSFRLGEFGEGDAGVTIVTL